MTWAAFLLGLGLLPWRGRQCRWCPDHQQASCSALYAPRQL